MKIFYRYLNYFELLKVAFLIIFWFNTKNRDDRFIGDITIMNVEVFARSLPHKYANPSTDGIDVLFFSIFN